MSGESQITSTALPMPPAFDRNLTKCVTSGVILPSPSGYVLDLSDMNAFVAYVIALFVGAYKLVLDRHTDDPDTLQAVQHVEEYCKMYDPSHFYQKSASSLCTTFDDALPFEDGLLTDTNFVRYINQCRMTLPCGNVRVTTKYDNGYAYNGLVPYTILKLWITIDRDDGTRGTRKHVVSRMVPR